MEPIGKLKFHGYGSIKEPTGVKELYKYLILEGENNSGGRGEGGQEKKRKSKKVHTYRI